MDHVIRKKNQIILSKFEMFILIFIRAKSNYQTKLVQFVNSSYCFEIMFNLYIKLMSNGLPYYL